MTECVTEQSKGVYIISATPFFDDGAIDYNSADSLIEFYINKGVAGITIPEMLVDVVDLFATGKVEKARDVFDVYLPIVRYEQQPGFGLAIRKEVLRRRGAMTNAATRAPGPKLSAYDHDELGGILTRLENRLKDMN